MQADFELKSPAQVKKMKKAEMFEHMEGLYELLEFFGEQGKKVRVENEKLKKEIEELKEENMKNIQDAYKCHYDKWKEEQENIVKEEIEELKK